MLGRHESLGSILSTVKKKKRKLFIRKNIKIYNFRRKNYGITFPSELDRKKIKRSVKN